MEKILERMEARLEKLEIQNEILRKELYGIRSSSNCENVLALMETLREVVKEIHFDVKNLNAELRNIQSQQKLESLKVDNGQNKNFNKNLNLDSSTLITQNKLSMDRNVRGPDHQWESDNADLNHDEKQTEAIVKQTQGIINRLTPQNLDKSCERFLKLDLSGRPDRIVAVSRVIFEMAIHKHSLSTTYAQMVHHVFQHSQETAKVFRKEILDQCQKEFLKTNIYKDQIVKKQEEIDEAPGDEKEKLKMELQDFRSRMMWRSLGNVQFIGELFKLQMLTPKIMLDCIQKLLRHRDEESYELLCKLLTTLGQKLDNALKDIENRARDAKARGGPMPKFIPIENFMEKLYRKLLALSGDNKLSSAVRLDLLHLVKLRESKCVPPGDLHVPEKIDEVEQEHISEELEEKNQILALPGIDPKFQSPGELKSILPAAPLADSLQPDETTLGDATPVILCFIILFYLCCYS